MAIYRLLERSAFGPREIARMTEAYEIALKRLRLANRSDPITEILAHYIVNIAQWAEEEDEPERIATLAIQKLNGK